MTAEWHQVATLDDLDPDYPHRVVVARTEVALYIVEGTVYATADVCSHAYARLSNGHVEGFQVFCPVHQASFDIRTGEATAQPADDPIPTYPVEVRDRSIYVQV